MRESSTEDAERFETCVAYPILTSCTSVLTGSWACRFVGETLVHRPGYRAALTRSWMLIELSFSDYLRWSDLGSPGSLIGSFNGGGLLIVFVMKNTCAVKVFITHLVRYEKSYGISITFWWLEVRLVGCHCSVEPPFWLACVMYLTEMVLERSSRDELPSHFGQLLRAFWQGTVTERLCSGWRSA